MIDWRTVRRFVHRRTYFCAVGVLEQGAVRLFPIGSLRLDNEGNATYFEVFARPVDEGQPVTFLAVDMNLWFWLVSLLRGKFTHPPAIRMQGTLGPRRLATEAEKARFHRAVGWLRYTRGGRLLWFDAKHTREVRMHEVATVRAGRMTRGFEQWALAAL
ncbi:MAG: pyridoxamine 5'-phosphate oxidase family protein [Candidatus Eremiobacteraeota bacterium]|nr:pyridoxamine 5'-phosphate oxidase family protein [Candidatus Eremiobacteraeota bacterium]